MTGREAPTSDTAGEQAAEGASVHVAPPRSVALVKGSVVWLASRAPWLRALLGPAYGRLSGRFYRWLARHEGATARRATVRRSWTPEVGRSRELFTAALERARAAAASTPAWEGRLDRTLSVIGSLGAGGSERQLVLFLRGAARPERGRPWLATTGHLYGASRHFLPQARRVARVVGLPRRGERASRESLVDLGAAVAELPAHEVREIAAMRRLVRRLQPSVVHTWLDWPCTVMALAALLEPVARVVLSTRSVNPSHFPALDLPYYRAIYRMVLADPRTVMCNNSSVGAADYADWLGVPRERITVVHNGFDAESVRHPGAERLASMRRRLSIPLEAPVVIGVLRMSEEKRPLVFVEAAELVLAQRADAVVLFVGDGVMRSEVDARVASCPHRERLRLLGRRDDAHDLIAMSDVLLLTSRMEGSPNVLLEAQALGCVPVSTRAGGAVDLVEDGVTGYLVPVDDARSLARRALEVLSDDRLWSRLREAGRRNVVARFGVQRMVQETLNLYG